MYPHQSPEPEILLRVSKSPPLPMRFLRENWIWIAVPVAIFVAAAVYLYTSGGGAYSGPGGYETH